MRLLLFEAWGAATAPRDAAAAAAAIVLLAAAWAADGWLGGRLQYLCVHSW